jgi:hypothetical protein
MAKVNGKADKDRSKRKQPSWDGSSSVKADDDDDISTTEDAKQKKASGPNVSGSSHAQETASAKGEGCITEATPVKEALPEKGEPANAKEFDSSFGWVELHGKRYDFDIIVHVDGSVTKREKGLSRKKKEKYGHTPLTSKELKVLGREAPEMIIIGTGHSGSMPLTPKAEKFLNAYPYYIGKTPEALERLAISEGKTVALLHVTC